MTVLGCHQYWTLPITNTATWIYRQRILECHQYWTLPITNTPSYLGHQVAPMTCVISIGLYQSPTRRSGLGVSSVLDFTNHQHFRLRNESQSRKTSVISIGLYQSPTRRNGGFLNRLLSKCHQYWTLPITNTLTFYRSVV